jgi:hypothetical protein
MGDEETARVILFWSSSGRFDFVAAVPCGAFPLVSPEVYFFLEVLEKKNKCETSLIVCLEFIVTLGTEFF